VTAAFKKQRLREIKRRHKELRRIADGKMPDETHEEIGRDETLDVLPDPD
jgi:hypothetical protein